MAKKEKPTGMSLTKSPVGVIGLGLAAYGVTALIFGGHSFAQREPSPTTLISLALPTLRPNQPAGPGTLTDARD
jgi:hypothetical protein